MKLNITPFPSNHFTYDKETKTLIAESSDLLGNHFQRLYDDACDVGIAIQSVKTQKVVTYYLHKTVKPEGREFCVGEVVAWEYLPTTESIRQVPECAGTSVTIFND